MFLSLLQVIRKNLLYFVIARTDICISSIEAYICMFSDTRSEASGVSMHMDSDFEVVDDLEDMEVLDEAN